MNKGNGDRRREKTREYKAKNTILEDIMKNIFFLLSLLNEALH